MKPPIMEYVKSILALPTLKISFGWIGMFFFAAIGDNYLAYETLFILITVDTISGFAKGLRSKSLSSRRMSRSVTKMLMYYTLVLSAHQLTRYAGYLQWFEDFIIIFLLTTELISIIENAHELGIPIPHWVIEKLQSYSRKPKYDK